MSNPMPSRRAAQVRGGHAGRTSAAGVSPAKAGSTEASGMEVVSEIIGKHRGKLGALSNILLEIQGRLGHLPQQALRAVAEGTNRPLVDVYNVIALSNCFTLRPPLASPSVESASLATTPSVARELRCRHCHHELVEKGRLVGGRPAARVTVSFGLEHGPFYFPAQPGETDFECEHDLPQTGAVHFFCPHCHAEVISTSRCAVCGAPNVPSVVPPGLILAVCANAGCRHPQQR